MSVIKNRREVGDHLKGSLWGVVNEYGGLEACADVASAMVRQLGDDDLAVQQRGLAGNRPKLSREERDIRQQAIFDLAGKLGLRDVVEECYMTPAPESGSAREVLAPENYNLQAAAEALAVLAEVDRANVAMRYNHSILEAYAGQLPKDIISYAQNHEIA